jgi:hypothetical protein
MMIEQQAGVDGSFTCEGESLLVDRASLPDRLAALTMPPIAGAH